MDTKSTKSDQYADVPDEAWAVGLNKHTPYWEAYIAGQLTAREASHRELKQVFRAGEVKRFRVAEDMLRGVTETLLVISEKAEDEDALVPEAVVMPLLRGLDLASKGLEEDVDKVEERCRSFIEFADGVRAGAWRDAHE